MKNKKVFFLNPVHSFHTGLIEFDGDYPTYFTIRSCNGSVTLDFDDLDDEIDPFDKINRMREALDEFELHVTKVFNK